MDLLEIIAARDLEEGCYRSKCRFISNQGQCHLTLVQHNSKLVALKNNSGIVTSFCMFCAFTCIRPRYQVNVYRTIGPLVSKKLSNSFQGKGIK